MREAVSDQLAPKTKEIEMGWDKLTRAQEQINSGDRAMQAAAKEVRDDSAGRTERDAGREALDEVVTGWARIVERS